MEEQGDRSETGKGMYDDQEQDDTEDEGESVYESMVGSKGYGGGYGEDERISEESSETEEEVEGESEPEAGETSEEETESTSDNQMHTPVYLDLAAKADSLKTKVPSAHELKSSQPQKKTECVEEAGWTGALQGNLTIRKRGDGGEVAPPGKWSFSGNGAARQPVKD
ncbi:hypothetical protein FRC12_015260 [Ceratobasidium sp. 428]|nr:hypothetical protein FRC12_015260 [Ceratobasidium sp. 428]